MLSLVRVKSGFELLFALVSKWFSYILLAIFPLIIGATVLVWEDIEQGISTRLAVIVLVDFVYVIAVISVLGYRILRSLGYERDPEVENPLNLTLVKVFTIVAVIPTVLVAIVASLGLNVGVGERVYEELTDELNRALHASNSYVDEKADELENYSNELSSFLENQFLISPGLDLGGTRQVMQNYQSEKLGVPGFAFIIDGNCQVIVRGVRSYLFDFDNPPKDLMEEITPDGTEVGDFEGCGPELKLHRDFSYLKIQYMEENNQKSGVVFERPNSNLLYALIKLDQKVDQYLYTTTDVSSPILQLRKSLTIQPEKSKDLVQELGSTIFQYSLVFLICAVFLVIAMIQFGFLLAERMSRPVKDLAQVAQRIGDGHLKEKIEVRGKDEIAKFGRVFQDMVRKLDKSISEEIAIRNIAESREKEFRGVLSSVSAGVIGLSDDETIVFMNRAAGQHLSLDYNLFNASDQTSFSAVKLKEVVPDFADLLSELSNSPKSLAQENLQISGEDGMVHLFVRIAKRTDPMENLEGYVIAFDDVTELVNAESKAAWSSVAQQIAHEIKNAMTPISLALTQLEYKIGDELEESKRDQLSKYTVTIHECMHGLIRISDEFSQFAKLPDPILMQEDLVGVCEAACEFERNRGEDVEIKVESSLEHSNINLDRELFYQMLTNLLKNSREGIDTRKEKFPDHKFDPQIRMMLQEQDSWILISILDNGAGFPSNLDLSEFKKPFITFREGGTGLGLAYAERIVEGHGGELKLGKSPSFDDDNHQGAMVQVRLPKMV